MLQSALDEQLGTKTVAQSAPVRLRKAYSSTQTAEIKLSLDAAKKLIAAGEVKVGWTVCTLRLIDQPERCYKCLGFGHRAHSRKGEDRTDRCWRCGELEHKAKDCTKTPKCMLCTEGDIKHATGDRSAITAARNGWR